MSLKNIKLFAYVLCSIVLTTQPTTQGLYYQLCPEILRTVNIQEPSEADQILINACIAFEQHGSQQEELASDIWDAIKSIDMFTHILPQYARTQTLSGYIALSRQVAQMTDNLEKLKAKTDLTTYLLSNPALQERMNKLITQAGRAESFFFHMFRTISQEEQEELDKIHNQLYFHNFGLEAFNENQAALEVGPRLNQLHTLAWCTVPPLLFSASHKLGQNYAQWTKLEQKEFDLKYVQKNTGLAGISSKISGTSPEAERKYYQDILDKNPDASYAEQKVQYWNERIAALEKYKDLSNTQITQELNAITEQFKKLNEDNLSAKQLLQEQIKLVQAKADKNEDISDAEKALLKINEQGGLELLIKEIYSRIDNNDFANDQRTLSKFAAEPLGMMLAGIGSMGYRKTFSKIMVPYTTNSLKTGFYNFPSYAYDTITKKPVELGESIYNHLTTNPVYYGWKKSLSGKMDPNSYSAMAVATGLTATSYTFKLIVAAVYPYILYRRYHATKDLMTLIHEKQQQLIMIGHWAKSMQLLHATMAHDSTLQALMSEEYASLGKLFNSDSSSISSDLKQLINALLSSSFQGNDSFMLSQQGKILATHHLLQRVKGELVPFFETQGLIDAKLSVVKLYQEFQNHPRVTFCLPTFVEETTPHMEAVEYWHPLISPNFVVPNTLTMGNNIKNLMITGPNAGGKTTSLMSLIINIILAQSWGIAPSKALTITPFAKIHSYLDITTNLQEGLSLFAAEVDRAKKLKISIASCTPGQKTFTIIDEIFSGTNPQVASDVGYTFAAQLGEMAHSMTIITTHFPRLTDIEKEVGTFTNYKVADATIMPDGKIVYPFKLIPGISTQNIAEHMLQQQGII